ncbi:chemotaxis protein CheD [Desulfuromonas sp. TF]|uniref:chemotaxis protein CheD n=1 Tax=Desulfuromonas sp. TF TaxID=1232410 RepID=UPI00040CF805|nr:chemotaxis protein CheD [Desulfuromonas sp. TF]
MTIARTRHLPAGSAAEIPTHFLYPGTVFIHPEPHRVTTVLGSCISVCLWDRSAGVGGINHFLLPLWNGEGLSTPRYGNIAIERLLEGMLRLGCRRESMVAKVFGGATMWSNPNGLIAIGKRNVELAWKMLQEQQIPILGSQVGGDVGRKIIFHSGTGEVMLRRCAPARPCAPASLP